MKIAYRKISPVKFVDSYQSVNSSNLQFLSECHFLFIISQSYMS